MARINKRTVDAATPTQRDRYLWDEALAGFGLKVTPPGRKIYLIQFRIGGRAGRTRRVTIGQHGQLTPEEARASAKRLLGEVAAGGDPAEVKQAGATPATLGFVLAQFLDVHVDAKLKLSSALEYRRIARLHVLPVLGRRRLQDISRADVGQLHHALRDRRYQANRMLAVLSKFFNWCERHGLRPDGSNPCRHVEKFPEKKCERFLSAEEFTRLGEALRSVEVEAAASPWAVGAVRLLALTGARLSEVLKLKWEFIEFEAARARLPDSKTGAKTIHLAPGAIAVLKALPKLDGNPFVICGERKGAHMVNLQKPWRRIRARAGLDDVRLHDLRHSFASVAAASGASLPMIGALLSHTQAQTTQRYAHLVGNPVRDAAAQIGTAIEKALGERT